MTEKRFKIDLDEEAITDNGEFCLSLYCFQDKGEKDVCDLLNELAEENKELKAKVDDKEVAVEVECEKLMQRVFDLIDKNINEYIYKEKLYKHKGKDREASVFNLYCFCLNNLKKELSE